MGDSLHVGRGTGLQGKGEKSGGDKEGRGGGRQRKQGTLQVRSSTVCLSVVSIVCPLQLSTPLN